MLALLLVTALQFPFAEPPKDNVPKISGNRIILIPKTQPPELERKCSAVLGEVQDCERRCFNNYNPNGGVLSCVVKTINCVLTTVCTCGEPGLFTLNDSKDDKVTK